MFSGNPIFSSDTDSVSDDHRNQSDRRKRKRSISEEMVPQPKKLVMPSSDDLEDSDEVDGICQHSHDSSIPMFSDDLILGTESDSVDRGNRTDHRKRSRPISEESLPQPKKFVQDEQNSTQHICSNTVSEISNSTSTTDSLTASSMHAAPNFEKPPSDVQGVSGAVLSSKVQPSGTPTECSSECPTSSENKNVSSDIKEPSATESSSQGRYSASSEGNHKDASQMGKRKVVIVVKDELQRRVS